MPSKSDGRSRSVFFAVTRLVRVTGGGCGSSLTRNNFGTASRRSSMVQPRGTLSAFAWRRHRRPASSRSGTARLSTHTMSCALSMPYDTSARPAHPGLSHNFRTSPTIVPISQHQDHLQRNKQRRELSLPSDSRQLLAWNWSRRQDARNAHTLTILELSHFKWTCSVKGDQLLHNSIVWFSTGNLHCR